MRTLTPKHHQKHFQLGESPGHTFVSRAFTKLVNVRTTEATQLGESTNDNFAIGGFTKLEHCPL